MADLYVITGSNGAGKSTVGYNYLPYHIQQQGQIFDGDKLFMQKQKGLWKAGIKAFKEAKRLSFLFVEKTFDTLVDNALATNSNFTYEGHFTNEATWDIPRRFKAAGYSIHLIFFGLLNTDLSELRVIARSNEGGHYVDSQTLTANFYGNLEKLDEHFAMFDSVKIIDTSEAEHKVLCVISNGEIESAIDIQFLPDWFIDNLKEITNKISDKRKTD